MSEAGPIERRLEPGDWDSALAVTCGPQLVVAGPGAGKTEFLVRRLAHLVDECRVDGWAVLTLTFSRRAASNLAARMGAAIRNPMGGLGASTFHSLAYRLLETYAPGVFGWTETPAILTGPEQVDLVSELLAGDPTRHWAPPFRNLLGSRTFAEEVTDFILRSRERMLGAGELAALCAGRSEWRSLPRFMARYDRALGRLGRIDYATVLTRAVELLTRPQVSESVAARYRYLLVDEYQDTTRAQTELLRRLAGPGGNLTVAADPYQSIYAFRGADLSNVTGFADDFGGDARSPVRRWILGRSFRVPSPILRAAERLTAGVELPGAAGPVDPAPHPGRVDLNVFDQESEESEWIAGEAARLHVEQDVPYDRMAVLVRTKRRLLKELSRALERRSIPHDRPDARLVDHPAAQMIFDLARAAAAPDRRSVAPPLRRLLLGPLFSLGVGQVRQLERNLLSADLTWAEAVRHGIPGGGPLALLLERPAWTQRPAIDGFWHAWTTLPQFRPLVVASDAMEFRAAWASLAQTLSRAAERNPTATLLDYARLVESDDFEAGPLLSYRHPHRRRMVLTTLHQAKGLEFDVVFIADAVEGVLPDLRRRESLLRTELLDPGRSGAGAARRRRLQEETRLVYTAMTRACRRVALTATSAGFDEHHRRPSRFLEVIAGEELPVAPADPGRRRPLTPREAEAWMRAIIADPSEPGHRRLGAARVLAAGAHPGLRAPGEFAPVRRPGADTGLLRGTRRLSPTDALGYRRCPREFVLQRVLRVTPASGPYVTFGALIHKVLERAGRRAAHEGRPSTLKEALAFLDDEFPRRELGEGSIRRAWRRRAVLLLDRLYSDRPDQEAPPLAIEHAVEMELGGAVWRGRIDRIDRYADGTLRIVDYKTGKTPPPVREAAGSLQLGFYLLAADSDDLVNSHGAVSRAEFWYPLADPPRRRVASFDTSRLEETKERLTGIAAGISREDWTPRPGNACRSCAVRLVCPAWPEGQEAFRR